MVEQATQTRVAEAENRCTTAGFDVGGATHERGGLFRQRAGRDGGEVALEHDLIDRLRERGRHGGRHGLDIRGGRRVGREQRTPGAGERAPAEDAEPCRFAQDDISVGGRPGRQAERSAPTQQRFDAVDRGGAARREGGEDVEHVPAAGPHERPTRRPCRGR